jgi:hypothetical protein
LKDLGVDGDNITHCILNMWAWRLWAFRSLSQVGDKWRVLSCTVMKRRACEVRGISRLPEELLDF